MGFYDIERKILVTGHLPECVTDEINCGECHWDDPRNCPLKRDPDFQSYLVYVYERHLESVRVKTERIRSLIYIYQQHGVPLHWERAATIAESEYPALFPSPNSVRQLLFMNPDDFEQMGDGVFRLPRRRKR